MADTTPSEAALRLQARLDELGWKAAKLADVIDVSPAVVSRWLAGKRAPSLEMAFRIQNSEVALPADIWRVQPVPDESSPVLPPDAPTLDALGAEDTGEHETAANDASEAVSPPATGTDRA